MYDLQNNAKDGLDGTYLVAQLKILKSKYTQLQEEYIRDGKDRRRI